MSATERVVEVDSHKLMQSAFRAVDKVGAPLVLPARARDTVEPGARDRAVMDGAAPHRRPRVRAHLYGMKYSHPVLASKMALELTGIPYQAHDILPGLHRIGVRLHGFRGWTVPALQIGSRKVQGTLAIMRELDRLVPSAGLFPADLERRAAVEGVERLGHDELQPLARRVFHWAGARDNAARAWIAHYVVGAPAPALAGYALKPVMSYFRRAVYEVDAAQVRADLARLSGLLDRVDEAIADGMIGGQAPNAADLQVLTSVRLLMAHEDVRPAIAPRPCGQAAQRLIPDYPRSGPDALPPVPAAFPPEWLPTAP